MHVFPRRWLFLGVCSVTLGIGETVVIATDVAFWLRRGDPMPLPFISVAKSMPVAAGTSMSRKGTDTISMSAVPRGATATNTDCKQRVWVHVRLLRQSDVDCPWRPHISYGSNLVNLSSLRLQGHIVSKSPGPKTFLSIGQMPVLRNHRRCANVRASE